MIKHRFYVGLSIAIVALASPVGAGWIAECQMIEVGQDHACCSERLEPTVEGCCSDEAPIIPDSDSCFCWHPPEPPSGIVLAVSASSPLVVIGEVTESAGSVTDPDRIDLIAGDSCRGRPGAPVAVFILDCAFLI